MVRRHFNPEVVWKSDRVHLLSLAVRVGYTPVNLGKIIKDGVLADIESIHRMTIDRAVEKKQMKEE